MSTYRKKIEKYKAKIDADHYAEKEPDSYDVGKLKFYCGKGAEKGLDHEVSSWQKAKAKAKATAYVASSAVEVTNIVKVAARILLGR